MDITLMNIQENFDNNFGLSLIVFLSVSLFLMISLNMIGYLFHKIRRHYYFKHRTERFLHIKNKYKVEKIYNRLERLDDYNRLPNRYKRRLEKYLKFLIGDLKYQVYCDNKTLKTFKSVSKVDVHFFSSLGKYKGNPKKVFKKAAKASRRKSGFLHNVLLFESMVKDKKVYGIKTKDGYIQLSYTLSWIE